MRQINSRQVRPLAVTLLVVAGLILAISSALALNSMLKTWEDVYPHSATGDASCSICHGSSTNNLNAYGKDLCEAFDGTIPADITLDLGAIEGLDSDGDGNSNLVEINAGAQPGWTTGPNLLYYGLDLGCAPTGASITVPDDVPLPHDPPVAGAPVADPGGPFTGNVDVPVVFDGSGSYDSDEIGDGIVSYAWDFGDSTTGTGVSPQHTYTTAGTYTVTLTVIDGEGATDMNATTATISGDPVLDLDIAKMDVSRTSRVGRSVSVKLQVNNDGPVLGQALATIVGEQGGEEVYRWRMNVYDYPGKKATSITFPSYTPEAKGTITWTATIADVDPDIDEATATTNVK